MGWNSVGILGHAPFWISRKENRPVLRYTEFTAFQK